MTTPGRRPPKARPVLPTAVTAVAAVLTAVGAFLPWYAPDIAPPLTPNSVSGWDATFAAKLLVEVTLFLTSYQVQKRVVFRRDRRRIAGTEALAVGTAMAAPRQG